MYERMGGQMKNHIYAYLHTYTQIHTHAVTRIYTHKHTHNNTVNNNNRQERIVLIQMITAVKAYWTHHFNDLATDNSLIIAVVIVTSRKHA